MEGDAADSLSRPCIEPAAPSATATAPASAAAGGSQTFDHATVRSSDVVENHCGSIQAMDDSKLVGVPVAVAPLSASSAVAVEVNPVATAMGNIIGGIAGKRKRGRPPKGQMVGAATAVKPPPPKRKKEEEEEDVCFICFDGGSLVLCDRKGCPKAYHPACIKRDEAFFRSKAKWNCGWHICSVCRKAAHYMCYTCTYSLCKGCTRNADYVCVRGTMGFCTTCMRTILLIENKEQADKELVQVDFDDQTSWEYLFKVYWVYLKEKLSLTLDELSQARNPCKGVVSMACKQQLPLAQFAVNCGNGFIANGPCEHLELNKLKEREEFLSKGCLNSEKPSNEKIIETSRTENGVSLVGPVEWASKELLEFVAHMKNGDASILSQFDVQALLLEYIKKNNLRDPRRKSQIICDFRLMNLFGKPRVGHIEMLKLLEFHFLIKEDSQKNAFIPAGIVNTLASHFGSDEYIENSMLTTKNKRRKAGKKVEERALQSNLDEYAAIDVHNINLIYLRRNLMENLTDDEKFQDRVVGSVVRIRISTNDLKQDMFRLVQVVGTSKVAEPYKVGEKTVNIMLEVLNLDKKEAIAIDAISNHEFTEDECRRLRQSIKCGLVRQLTVGEIQKKAMELQAVRLSDSLEAEILKLNHLRDLASEKGHKKEECVEKLQLLKTPEERQRRLSEVPEVHADPKMNPDYDSEENNGRLNDEKQDECVKQKYSGFSRSGSRSITSEMKVKEDGHFNLQQGSNYKRDASGLSDQDVFRSGPENSTAILASGSPFSSDSSETDKLWHYRDPNGNVQGPFSMLQMRKWSTTGYFPLDMRIWISNEQDDSVLLTDALNGQFHTAADLLFSLSIPRPEVGAASDNQIYNNSARGDEKGTLQSNNLAVECKDNNEFVKTDWLRPIASDCATSVVSYKERQPGNSQQWDSLKENSSCIGHSEVHHPLHPSDVRQTDVALPHAGQTDVALPHAGQAHGSEGSTHDPHHGNQVSDAAAYQVSDEKPLENQANSKSNLAQSSEQNWRAFPINLNSTEIDTESGLFPEPKSDSSNQNGDMDSSELPSPTPKASNGKSEGQAAEKLQPSSSAVPAQTSDIPNIPGLAPKPIDGKQGGQAAESKKPPPSKFIAQDSGRSWSSASSSRVAVGAQLPEIADEWGQYSPTSPKPPVQEWSSGLVSVSSLKQTEAVGDHANPTSTCNASGWHGVVEPIEFSTLAEESVSDLLAEVDAMESQSGLASPTSAMRGGDEMMKVCKSDYFSSIDDLSPTCDPGKSDALSSTENIPLPCQTTVRNEPVGTSLADAYDSLKRSSGHSSTSSDGETKSADVPANRGEAGSAVHPPPSRTMSRDNIAATIPPSTGMEAMDTGWGRAPVHVNMDWGAPVHGTMNMGWGTSHGMPYGAPTINRSAYSGGVVWDGQRRYSAERYPGHREWASQGGDIGYGRGRPFWNRQSGGGGGGYSRPPPKGQRVCKFYESGHCKKGSSCSYWHP